MTKPISFVESSLDGVDLAKVRFKTLIQERNK